jgi:hypothetical protein
MSSTVADPTILDDPAAIAGGNLIIITVEAIKERAPSRWHLKQDTVWEFTERQFQKDFPKTDVIRRLNDTDYLVAQANASGHAAQHRATNLLRTVVTFFLGSSSPAQLKVLTVKSMADGAYETEALTIEQIEALSGPAPEPAPVEVSPRLEQAHPPTQFKVSVEADRHLEVLVLIEPIWNISKQAIASYYIRPNIFEVRNGQYESISETALSIRDMLEVDLIILRNSARVIVEALAAGYTFALHIPISFRSLRSTSCRATLSRYLPTIAILRKYIIFCIVGVPDGAPRGLLAEAASAFKQYANGVVMLASTMNEEPKRWLGLGLSAVAVDLIGEDQSGPEFMARLQNFGAACDGVAAGVIAHAVSKRPTLLAACAAGFTHVSGSVISDKVPETRSAVRFPTVALYT